MNFDEFRKALTAYQMTGALADIRNVLLELMTEMEYFKRFEASTRDLMFEALFAINSLMMVINDVDEKELNKARSDWSQRYNQASDTMDRVQTWLADQAKGGER